MKTMIHGHEVLKMMLEAEAPYTSESLLEAMLERFGPDARFYTCSASDMAPGELIRFLARRGKFEPRGDGFGTSADKICHH